VGLEGSRVCGWTPDRQKRQEKEGSQGHKSVYNGFCGEWQPCRGQIDLCKIGKSYKGIGVEADVQPTTDDDAKVTVEGLQLRSVGQISVAFERGVVGKSTGKPYRPKVVQMM